MAVEHFAVCYCIQIQLSTKTAIVEEEMPSQDAVGNNPFLLFHQLLFLRGDLVTMGPQE